MAETCRDTSSVCIEKNMLHFVDEFETSNVKIVRHNIGSFGVNTYFLICKKTLETAVIDPGGEEETLLSALRTEKADVRCMLFTHTHIDHIYGADGLKKSLPGAKVMYHSFDQPVVDATPDMCAMFGVPVRSMPKMEQDLKTEPEFSLGMIQLRSFLTPGHTPGGVCFYIPEEKILFTGDTLFRGSVGRTDFEGGSGSELRKSLDFLIETIPDDVRILPGHGKYSTMADEKASNFYLRVDRWR